jgi:MFS transporter, ACS family, glucarate transporter
LLRVRWLVLALLFGFAFTGYVQRTSVAIAAERMMPELGLTQVQVGWLLTAFLFSYSVCQLPGGLLGQRFGARRTLTGLGLASVLATGLTAAAPSLAAGAALLGTLLLARSLLGVAQAALFPVVSGAIQGWFPVRAWASAQGLIVTGLWCGAAATPPLVAWLMQRHGWRWALVVAAAPSLLLVALWHACSRDRPADHPAVRPDELAELAENPVAPSGNPASWPRLRRVLRDPQILRITASYFVMNYVFYLVTFWSFLYLVQDRRMTALESGALASLPFLVAGTASAVGGDLADRLRVRLGDRVGMRVLPLAGLPSAAVFLYLTVRAESTYGAVAALCLGFACVEITEGSFWGATMRLAPTDTMAATAVLNTGGNLGGVVATPIIAALSARHGWPAVFATGAATAVAAAALWLTVDASGGAARSKEA